MGTTPPFPATTNNRNNQLDRTAHYRNTRDVWQELWRWEKQSLHEPTVHSPNDMDSLYDSNNGTDINSGNLKLHLRTELEQLQYTNYTEWISTLRDVCAGVEADWMVQKTVCQIQIQMRDSKRR